MYAILGNSPWACAIRQSISRVAAGHCTVLITGPSGTGKELIAHAIHAQSRRRDGPLVPVDCASVPTALFASQLFGHVKGAYSGADRDTLGSFRAADGGTIFLDEIGELGLDLQAHLLRVIQGRAVTPVGHHGSIPVDVRIIAATNRDLKNDIAAGRFRLDLYYRLNVARLATSPLSQRAEDIEPLCRSFLDRWFVENGPPAKRLSPEAVQALMACDWPGNVRQLQNILERATMFGNSEEISAEHVMEAYEADIMPAIAGQIGNVDESPPAHPCRECGLNGPACCRRDSWPTLAECESRLIRETLEQTFYNQRAAARLLGIDWRMLSRKMHKYGISAPRRARCA
jgi:DNA-binding NtrC family response regulator